mgnify:CR=1 FL=1
MKPKPLQLFGQLFGLLVVGGDGRGSGLAGGLGLRPELGQGFLELLPAHFVEVDQVALDLGLADLVPDPLVLGRLLLFPAFLDDGLGPFEGLADLLEFVFRRFQPGLGPEALFAEGPGAFPEG